jgi:hypothetical protein
LCPEIPIHSAEFSIKLLDEVTRLRNEIEEGNRNVNGDGSKI